MNPAKIHLSEEELAMVQNAHWLLTKNRIIDKVMELFGELSGSFREMTGAQPALLPAEVLAVSPKISKGEKYRGLPYMMLDYPRLFGKEHIFAIRTMFWWGHYFSITLHLKGNYKTRYQPALQKHLRRLGEQGFHIGIIDDEWEHDLSETNYTAITQLDEEAIRRILSRNDFCKLSVRISLLEWNRAKIIMTDLYHVVLQSITD